MKQLKNITIIACGVLAIVALIVSCCVEWPVGVKPNRVCDNNNILHPTQKYKFVAQFIILLVGLQLWITCTFMEGFGGSTNETRRKWKDKIYPVVVVVIGMVLTLTLAIPLRKNLR